ncbi:MAG TPA: DUF1559 domain-containing protein [Gemmataceae bacterium]|nr:DUF1559 domain-containing protein [Gemmataceae bacterium]
MRGFIHILIVAFVCLVGAGLVILFAQRARETANRTRCMHNLMQIGEALHNYDARHRFPPPGTIPNPDLPPERRLSWQVELLPFIGKGDVYQRIDREKPWDAVENQPAVNTLIHAVVCPANYSGRAPDSPGPTHYVGIAGVGKDAAALPLRDPRAGFFGYDRKCRFADAERGVSSTLVALETASENGPWAAGGWPTVRGLDPDRQPYLGVGGQFGGIHRGGAFALFADLSVQFLSEEINPRTLESMATLAGGDE